MNLHRKELYFLEFGAGLNRDIIHTDDLISLEPGSTQSNWMFALFHYDNNILRSY